MAEHKHDRTRNLESAISEISDARLTRGGLLHRGAAAIVGLSALGSFAHLERAFGAVDDTRLTWVDGGGAYHNAVLHGYLEPYTKKTGVKFNSEASYDSAKLRAQVESKHVIWDIFNGDNTFGTDRDGKWLEPIDYGVVRKSEIRQGFVSKYRVANMIYSIQLAYNTKELGSRRPQNWADFFNLDKFPGKRGVMDYSVGGIFEIALLGDGVSPKRLYPLDLNRAIKKLNTIKDELVFWSTGAQSEDLIGTGEVSMAMMYNARAYDARFTLKKPIGWTFNQQILAAAYLTIPKGTKNKAEAMKFAAYAVSKDVNGRLSKYVPVAPANRLAKPDPKTAKYLPTEHLRQPYAVFDDFYIAKNAKAIEKRYQAWKTS